MKIVKTHHIDASDADENGLYDYYYEYDVYEFSDGDVSYIVRRYSDEPSDAHFLKKHRQDNWRLLEPSDLDSALFAAAVASLRQEGIVRIRVLGNKGYVAI